SCLISCSNFSPYFSIGDKRLIDIPSSFRRIQQIPIYTMSNDENDLPKIISFSSTKSRVLNKEQFSLQWEVDNARTIEIYRNGKLLREFLNGEQNIALQENYDGKDKDVEYSLVAVNDLAKTDSLPVHIRVTEGAHISRAKPVVN